MKTTCRQAMVIKDWYSARISDSIIVTTYRHSDGTKCLGADCGKEQAAAPTLGHPGCKNPEWGKRSEFTLLTDLEEMAVRLTNLERSYTVHHRGALSWLWPPAHPARGAAARVQAVWE